MTRDTAERAREIHAALNSEACGFYEGGTLCLTCRDDIMPILDQIQAEARERLAAWMVERSFSTGHGDTFEDLLKELDWQVKELRGAREQALEEAAQYFLSDAYIDNEHGGNSPLDLATLVRDLKQRAALAQALQTEEREGANVRADISVKE